MTIEKLTAPTHWCVVCDEAFAIVNIGNGGGFRLYWADSPTDLEICLCKDCFGKLKGLIEEVDLE